MEQQKEPLFLKDIVSGPGSSSSSGLAVFDSFFIFTSGFLGHDELFISDGTTDGTHLLKDIYPGNPSSNAIGFFKFRDQIFFRASDYRGSELWKTDGTYSGTVIVKDINPSGSSYPQNFKQIQNKLVFAATNHLGTELWCTDGTPAGTIMIKDIYEGPGNSYPRDLVIAGNAIIFTAEDTIHGREIWKTDGTAEGTKLLIDFYPGPIGSNPGPFINLNDQIIFSADNGLIGKELWDLTGLCIAPSRLALDQSPPLEGTYQAENSIRAKGSVADGNIVEFLAGQQVEILPGFKVGSTALFTINIETCGNE